MRFALSSEQTDFSAVLHSFLADGNTDLARVGADEVTDPVDLVVLFDEVGHHALPGPLIESLAVLPALGVTPGSVAIPPHVPYAVTADRYYLLEDTTLRSATAGAALSSVDPSRQLVSLVGGDVLATDVDAERAFNLGALACAAQLLGLGRAMLEMSTQHALVRTQFGRPIGSFQAVKHQLADVLIGLELARPLVFGAALSTTTRDVSAAKVAAGDAAWRAARAALQVHGAVGYTAEHPLSAFLTRTRALVGAWGDPSVHRARVLEAL